MAVLQGLHLLEKHIVPTTMWIDTIPMGIVPDFPGVEEENSLSLEAHSLEAVPMTHPHASTRDPSQLNRYILAK